MTICRYSLNVLRLQFNLGTRKIVSFLAGNKSGDNQGLDPSPDCRASLFSDFYDNIE